MNRIRILGVNIDVLLLTSKAGSSQSHNCSLGGVGARVAYRKSTKASANYNAFFILCHQISNPNQKQQYLPGREVFEGVPDGNADRTTLG